MENKTLFSLHHPWDSMTLRLHGTLEEILKINWLLGDVAGGVFVPVHWGDAFSAFLLCGFVANSSHRGGYQRASKSTDE